MWRKLTMDISRNPKPHRVTATNLRVLLSEIFTLVA
jgi:hypothetical protein